MAEPDSLLRRWKAWERGDNQPSAVYRPHVAAALGVATASLFPPRPAVGSALLAGGASTLDLLARLDGSDVDRATLDGLRATVERLCCDYAARPAGALIVEGRDWLRRVVHLQDGRLSLRDKSESLEVAGWLALLVGCLEYDLGDRAAAETTRKAAQRIGQEIGHAALTGWAFEMRAWFALTSNDLRGTIAAARQGLANAAGESAGVQLYAQEAKAWARMGRREETQRALDKGRDLLDALPYPDDVRNHFVVDPMKFDFYAMDCYRMAGDDRLAAGLANEVILAGLDHSGRVLSPMRVTEARLTLGVVAAREGDLDAAIAHGDAALCAERRSLPSLGMVAGELRRVVAERYRGERRAQDFISRTTPSA
ncbi:XRE family transcriptional regulator [Angustibacter sp. McL0619]|uniref:XRE family transcriptional regulator n=1 Tax=Angustibacter sp. McL0619 TaxID=3415676 RepID=UPI003CF29833